jgi:hypothetical protein
MLAARLSGNSNYGNPRPGRSGVALSRASLARQGSHNTVNGPAPAGERGGTTLGRYRCQATTQIVKQSLRSGGLRRSDMSAGAHANGPSPDKDRVAR